MTPRLKVVQRICVACLLISLVFPAVDARAVAQTAKVPKPEFEFLPPTSVSIFPVFFVSSDQPNPPRQEAELLMRHLQWAQRWFLEQLKGGGTFEIFGSQPYLLRGRHPLAHYVALPAGERAPVHLEELLEHFEFSRFNCPFIFVIIVDEKKERPAGGRPINSGFNGGGGIVQMSRAELTKSPGFQSTLRHELGHSFGLQHVSLYDYDMKTNRSTMAYNQQNRTNKLQESPTPAILIPEDIRALALNDRVFPRLEFDPQKHVPAGYSLSPRMSPLPPMKLPNHPDDKVTVVSRSGEEATSRAQNLVRRRIVPNERNEANRQGINYDPSSMWHSDDTKTPWRTLEVTFPVETRLTAIRIHSQHSGRVHPVRKFRLSVFG
ncbi:MAG: hypothetical protein KDA81_14980, partial [Planctomycetaceae bacterium]|nr:hypothetical protein [Planctomycetaceae bacterium]